MAVFCIIAPASLAYGASQTYTLTFDGNCNNDSSYTTSITTKAVAQGDSYGVLPAPTRKGYAFDGWYTAATGGTVVSATIIMGSNNATVYAHWTAYVLTINYMNDGAQKWHCYATNTYIDCTNLEIAETETVAYNELYKHAEYGILDVNRFQKQDTTPTTNGKSALRTALFLLLIQTGQTKGKTLQQEKQWQNICMLISSLKKATQS